jgi:hypothetical protein
MKVSSILLTPDTNNHNATILHHEAQDVYYLLPKIHIQLEKYNYYNLIEIIYHC